MSTLSSKSDKEITQLLDDYGIKHGPVVDTTRALYEKKLKEAMAKNKRSPDKTYYREEEEEITYVTSRTPVREDSLGDRKTYSRLRTEKDSGQDLVYEKTYSRLRTEKDSGKDLVYDSSVYDTPSTYRNISSLKQTPMKTGGSTPETTKSSRLIPRWVLFLIFLALAAFLYFVFTNMESSDSGPFKKIV